MVGGPEGKGDIPDAVRAIKSTAGNLDKKIDGLVSDGRRTLAVIERAVRNLDENPSRLIFGGGKPGNPPPARRTQRRPAAGAGRSVVPRPHGAERFRAGVSRGEACWQFMKTGATLLLPSPFWRNLSRGRIAIRVRDDDA